MVESARSPFALADTPGNHGAADHRCIGTSEEPLEPQVVNRAVYPTRPSSNFGSSSLQCRAAGRLPAGHDSFWEDRNR